MQITKEKKEQILSIFRVLLLAAGSFFAGKMIFGTAISGDLWKGIAGSIAAASAVIWGIKDKTATVEAVLSAGRSLIVVFGGLLVASGKLKDDTLDFITLAFTTLVPLLMARASTVKNQQIATGELPIAQLKGVDETKPENITPTKIIPNPKPWYK